MTEQLVGNITVPTYPPFIACAVHSPIQFLSALAATKYAVYAWLLCTTLLLLL